MGTQNGQRASSPAVILASISTRESSGIQHSGSSTRSWIGMLYALFPLVSHLLCPWPRWACTGNHEATFENSPLAHDRIVFHAAREGRRCVSPQKPERYAAPRPKTVSCGRGLVEPTYLLMLSILSILVMPSQWRMSGIRAWKRMSLTPATFSVRLK